MPPDAPDNTGAPAATETTAAAPATPPPVSPASVSPPVSSDGAPGQSDPDWLNKRIRQAKENGGKERVDEVLKELGVASIADARAKISAAQAAEDAKKTEIEKKDERIRALEADASRVKSLTDVVTQRATAELATLTDAQRELVMATAGDDPAKQLATIDLVRKAAPAPAGSPAKQPVPAPASTTAAGAAPTPATPSNPDKKAVLESLERTNPMAAAHYALRNERELYTDPNRKT
jgi:hypothetical protein